MRVAVRLVFREGRGEESIGFGDGNSIGGYLSVCCVYPFLGIADTSFLLRDLVENNLGG